MRLCVATFVAAFVIVLGIQARADPPAAGVEASPEAGNSGSLALSFYGMSVSSFGYDVRLGLGYERPLDDHFTLEVSGVFEQATDDGGMASRRDSFGVRVAPNYYFRSGTRGGLYIAPFATLAYDRASLGDIDGSALGYSLGATIGWAAVIGRAKLKIGVGVEYDSLAVDLKTTSGSVSLGPTGVAPALTFSVGFVL